MSLQSPRELSRWLRSLLSGRAHDFSLWVDSDFRNLAGISFGPRHNRAPPSHAIDGELGVPSPLHQPLLRSEVAAGGLVDRRDLPLAALPGFPGLGPSTSASELTTLISTRGANTRRQAFLCFVGLSLPGLLALVLFKGGLGRQGVGRFWAEPLD